MNAIQAEELKILIEFDRVCKKHDLKYSLGYGTLIGVVRHHGFIPWDDDVDIIMSREEYTRFLTIIDDELNDDFCFVNHEREKNYWYGFGKIRSNKILLPEKSTEYLGIKQGVWIDIFPFDTVPDDEVLKSVQRKKLKHYHNLFVAFVFTHPQSGDAGLKKVIKAVCHGFNRVFARINPFLSMWYKKMEQEARMFEGRSEYCNGLSLNFTDREYEGSIIPCSDLEDTIDMEFEGVLFPVIRNYDAMLTGIYGDYMTYPKPEDQRSVHDVSEMIILK